MRTHKLFAIHKHMKMALLLASILLLSIGILTAQGEGELPGVEYDDDDFTFSDAAPDTDDTGEIEDDDSGDSSDSRPYRFQQGASGKDMDGILKYAGSPGVLISDIFVDSPAERAGLLRGDVILEVEGVEVYSVSEISELLKGLSHGAEISITILRASEEIEVMLTLETRIGYPLIGIMGDRNRAESFGKPGMKDEDLWNKKFQWEKGFGSSPRGPGFMFDFDGSDGEDDKSELPFGGLEGLDIPDEIMEAVMSGDTALISEVVENSPADEAGLEADTIVIAVNGVEIEDGDLAAAILEYSIGETVELTIGSLDGIEQVSVELGENNGNPFLGVAYYPFVLMPNMGWRMDNFPNMQSPWNKDGKAMPNFRLPEAEEN